jgi:plastocyanin
MTNPHTRRATMTMALAVVLIAAACSNGDADSTSTTTADEAASPVVEVEAIDFAYVGLPAQVDAGTEFRLTNASEVELHELVAVKLPDEESRSVTDIVQLPQEEIAAFFSGVATVVIAPPGGDGIPVVGTGVLTEPGRYAIICAIPTGADPDDYMAAAAESDGPPEVDGGPPHFVHGMIGEVIVNG